jgi:DNA modification methylase
MTKGKTDHFPDYKTVPVADLIPYARNARTHSDAQVAKIAASIREFGFLNPIIVDGARGIIAGHGRVMAAQKLGLTIVPVIEAGHLTEAQKRAYVLADNRLALDAGWDLEMLRVELTDLKGLDFDLSLTGFEIGELGKLMLDPSAGLTDPDDIPEPPAEPVSVLGDVWLLGRHRIACGSSTDAATVTAVLAGVKPHLMVTDPPYGVEYDAQWRTDAGVNKRGQNVATGKVSNDDQADWREAWALFPGDVAYVWHGALHAALVAESLASAGFAVRSQIIWAKQSLVIGRGHYHWQHEPCWYVVRKNATGHWAGDRKQSTLWQIANMHRTQGNVDDGKTVHSTQKPVECMKRPIENNSSPGQAVYEPFSGSGTTIIAGEMTGRSVHAIELNPAYVDVAVKRWMDFTGLQATLDGDGRTFAEIEAERASDRAA